MKVIIDSQKLNQPGENIKVDLQHVLDNTIDKYTITPVEISYYVGYYNLTSTNNSYRYSNGTTTFNNALPEGLYSISSYFDAIKKSIPNPANINYVVNNYNGTITIQVTSPYTFSIIQSNLDLLGFNSTQTISTSANSDNPINFFPRKMIYVHLKQIKNNFNYYNGNKSDILARVPITTDIFGTLVQHKFDRPYVTILDNMTINNLELTITDENDDIIDFHGMPVFYTLEINKL
jgi:hypothetical protein